MPLMDLFKKKEAITSASEDKKTPLSQALRMQSQGLQNNQIISALQQQGYPVTAIYDALSQAEVKKTGEPMETQQEQQTQRHPDTELLIEQIIEEKWHDLQKDIARINEWKEAISSRMDKTEQAVADMKADLEGLHKAIVARIGEYDKTLLDVGTEIKAMEKVFQKVLPELTGNIQELSRITKNVRADPKSKK